MSAFVHVDLIDVSSLSPEYLRSMSTTSTPWQGTDVLHVISTGTFDVVVPQMFLKWTSLIATLDGYIYICTKWSTTQINFFENLAEIIRKLTHIYVCVLRTEFERAPYFWFITMAVPTSVIPTSSKVMPEALLGSDPSQVLILTPNMVSFKVTLDTVTPLTSSSFEYLPRLPILQFQQYYCVKFWR